MATRKILDDCENVDSKMEGIFNTWAKSSIKYIEIMLSPPFLYMYILCCVQVGQIQLIRRQIHREMNRTCKFDSKLLANSLQALNQ